MQWGISECSMCFRVIIYIISVCDVVVQMDDLRRVEKSPSQTNELFGAIKILQYIYRHN